MSSLPPGVTNSMCDGVSSYCGNCGHEYSEHYENDKELYVKKCERDGDMHIGAIEYDNKGKISNGCDIKKCFCEGFYESEYEPDYDDYTSDLD